MDKIASAHLERFICAKYAHRLFVQEGGTLQSSPFSESFRVLLRRSSGDAPFGLAPRRSGLCRGVLQLRSGPAPGSPAEEWNALQSNQSVQLQEGDCLLKVNGIPVLREDAGAAALQQMQQQPQVFLEVQRLKPPEGLTYAWLVFAAYALFNPMKLNDADSLLAKNKGTEKDLLFRICQKYALTFEDWRDFIQLLQEHCGDDAISADMTAKAAARLGDCRVGEESLLLEALCSCLVGDGSCSEEHLLWNKLELKLQRTDASSPLGLLHDRSALQERSALVVRDLVPDSPAALAGVQVGDIVERIGSRAAVEVVLQKLDIVDDDDGKLLLIVRRPPKP